MYFKYGLPLTLAAFILFNGCKEKKVRDSDMVKSDFQENVVTDSYGSEGFGVLLKRYEDPERELWQNPDLVVEKLGNLGGKVVADIGVGTGYFTFKVANEAEKVIAIDVENKFLEYIEERKFELGTADIVEKIETRLCKPEDPLLKDDEADIALIVDTYHFIDNRTLYMKNVHKGLKEEGLVLLVDYKKGDMPVGPPEKLKIDLSIALNELKEAGFEIGEVDTASLQFQYIIKAFK